MGRSWRHFQGHFWKEMIKGFVEYDDNYHVNVCDGQLTLVKMDSLCLILFSN